MNILRLIGIVVAWACAALALMAFHMPWIHLDIHEPSMMKQLRQSTPLSSTLGGLTKDVSRITAKIQQGAKTVTRELNLPSLDQIPHHVSGADIPRLANSDQAQLAAFVMETLTKKPQQYGQQSYLVYLVPGLAIVLALLLTVIPRPWWAILLVAMVSGTIAGIGGYKLMTTNLQSQMMTVTIGQGIWLSLWAYAGLAVAGMALTLSSVQAYNASPRRGSSGSRAEA